MKRYESKRHAGVFAETTGIFNEHTHMLTMIFDNGKTQDISKGTLKRWWKLVDNPKCGSDENSHQILVETPEDISFPETTAEAVIEQPTEVVPVEETLIEIEPIEIVTEPPKQVPKTNKDNAKVTAEALNAFRDAIEHALIDMGLTKVTYAMDNVTLFRAGKKTVIRLYFGKRNLVFHVHPEIIPDGMQYSTQKYFLSAVFHKDYSESTLNFVKMLMSVYNSNN